MVALIFLPLFILNPKLPLHKAIICIIQIILSWSLL